MLCFYFIVSLGIKDTWKQAKWQRCRGTREGVEGVDICYCLQEADQRSSTKSINWPRPGTTLQEQTLSWTVQELDLLSERRQRGFDGAQRSDVTGWRPPPRPPVNTVVDSLELYVSSRCTVHLLSKSPRVLTMHPLVHSSTWCQRGATTALL